MHHILLYIHDSNDLEKTSREVEILKERLPEYRIATLDVTQEKKTIEATLRAEKPDVIVAEGKSASNAHTMAGHDRICINPVSDESNFDFPNIRSVDQEQSSHCWGIIGLNCTSNGRRNFSMLYYPNVINIDRDIKSLTDIQDVLIPLIESVGESDFTDKYGVHYANYGRTLVGVDHVLFRDVWQYEILEGTTTINDDAFVGMDLEKISFPKSLHHIGKRAFMDCRKLNDFILPKGVDVVRASCFEGCISLSKVTLSPILSSIHRRAFRGTSVREISLPDSIQGIAHDAFDEGTRMNISMSRLKELLDNDCVDHHLNSCKANLFKI